MKSPRLLTVAIVMALAQAFPGAGQEQGGFAEGEFTPIGIPPVPFPPEPVVYHTAEGRIRVEVIADGLRRPQQPVVKVPRRTETGQAPG